MDFDPVHSINVYTITVDKFIYRYNKLMFEEMAIMYSKINDFCYK